MSVKPDYSRCFGECRRRIHRVRRWRTMASSEAMEFAQADGKVQQAIDTAFAALKALSDGSNADYIPALANVDADLFGIVVVTADGTVRSAGDVTTEVSIQSI